MAEEREPNRTQPQWPVFETTSTDSNTIYYTHHDTGGSWHTYVATTRRNGILYLKCRQKNCNAKLQVEGHHVLRETGSHDHPSCNII